eukprot:3151211-Alexandrium_andersonii.AAC.1
MRRRGHARLGPRPDPQQPELLSPMEDEAGDERTAPSTSGLKPPPLACEIGRLGRARWAIATGPGGALGSSRR